MFLLFIVKLQSDEIFHLSINENDDGYYAVDNYYKVVIEEKYDDFKELEMDLKSNNIAIKIVIIVIVIKSRKLLHTHVILGIRMNLIMIMILTTQAVKAAMTHGLKRIYIKLKQILK